MTFSNKIKVLHIYQNSKIGGIQQQILSLIKSYDRSAIDPAFCCLGSKKEIGKELERIGVEVFHLDRKRYHRFSPGIIGQLYSLMKEQRFHIVRTHKYRSNFYGRISAWLAGIPVIISSEHNIYVDKEKRVARRIINRWLAGITDKMVAVSDAIRSGMIKYDRINPEKVITLRNGVDTDRFNGNGDGRRIRNELHLQQGDVVLGFIGRLVKNKGLEYLISAVSILKEEYDNVKLLIVGNGSQLNYLQDRARDYGLDDDVTFVRERRDVIDILACIDIFVMPSVKEGLPNALLEAMAMKKPIVATKVGGIPEIVQNGKTGLLVEPEKPEALAEGLKELIVKKELAGQMSDEARKFISENYSINATVDKWQSLYLELLEGKGIVS